MEESEAVVPKHVPEVDVLVGPHLRRARMIALLGVGVPTLGTIAALALLRYRPLTWLDATLFLILYVYTTIGIEVGVHRLFTHRAFEATPALRAFLAIGASMAFQGTVDFWVAEHRRHHQYSDEPGDPHTPHQSGSFLRGFMHAHLGWMFGNERACTRRYARDILKDRALGQISRHYFRWLALGVALPTIIGGLASGPSLYGALTGFLWGGMVRIFVLQQAIYAINSFGHTVGRRPFPAGGYATNIASISFFSFGGSLHNAHHAFPWSAKNSNRWFEVDYGWGAIQVFRALKAATNVKVPTPTQLDTLGKKTTPATLKVASDAAPVQAKTGTDG